ncbi:putative bifunctional diguanylate cyclase/phosphodiesterase [Marinibactrum halimedae]|uniref:Bifunctional diguanylate cyclase/phosphodiesterase n=1 Tax=Marinibactrum halimedae TaxID=1444977 RepID=A0AA37T7B0_9GAMM|nr:GGDEF and EAL domain-containing protein [Marinibactrum halimedae]MCD9458282.1 EAL domain-containing protein [Marinibactrum halimedae]GLS27091.1 hypothetical protein GCM10007877_28100 [Marinibactrum halimedae]
MEPCINVLVVVERADTFQMLEQHLEQSSQAYRLRWQDSLDGVESVLEEGEYDAVLIEYHWGEVNCKPLISSLNRLSLASALVVLDGHNGPSSNRFSQSSADSLLRCGYDCLTISLDRLHQLDRTIRFAIEHKLPLSEHFDSSTQLPSHRLLMHRLNHVIPLSQRNGDKFALLLVEFDVVCESEPQQVSVDQLISHAAKRLRGIMRRSDFVARVSGQQFAILLEGIEAVSGVSNFATKVIERFATPESLADVRYSLACRIGAVVHPPTDQSSEAVFGHALSVLNESDYGEFRLYRHNKGDFSKESERLNIESQLNEAIAKKEFILQYQPRFELDSGNIVGVEALLRWQHPERGLLQPQEFMEVAESSGLICDIGRWVMVQACRDWQVIQRSCGQMITMAINLSPKQFADHSLVDVLEGLRLEADLDSFHGLELEITETQVLDNLEFVATRMEQLAEMGVYFSLDDFGTGYSSFVHLQQLPIQALKIDRTFINRCDINKDDAVLVDAIVKMAKSLGKSVIAEGVETSKQQQLLLLSGCDQAQGFFLSEPLDLHHLCALLMERPSRESESSLFH